MRFLCVLLALALAGCSTLTVEADASRQVSGSWDSHLHDGRNATLLPLARVALGVEPQLTETLSAPISIEHRSYFVHGDRGEERVSVGLKWQPWKRQ